MESFKTWLTALEEDGVPPSITQAVATALTGGGDPKQAATAAIAAELPRAKEPEEVASLINMADKLKTQIGQQRPGMMRRMMKKKMKKK